MDCKTIEGDRIKKDAIVEILQIEGVKLVVKQKRKGGECRMFWFLVPLLIIIIAAIVINIRIVPQATAFVIERLGGAYKATWGGRTPC